jgi:hypothetical protein
MTINNHHQHIITQKINATKPTLHPSRDHRLQRIATGHTKHQNKRRPHPHEPIKQLLCDPPLHEPAQKLRCTPTTPREQADELRRGPSHEPAQKLHCTALTPCKQTKQKLHQGPSSAKKTQKETRCLGTKQEQRKPKQKPTHLALPRGSNRPSLFTADDTIQTPSNQAPMLPSQVIIRYPTAPSTKDLETNQQRRSATTKQRRDKRTKLTEKENKNMSKLPSQTKPPNTTYLRPRPPTDALRDAVSLVANWQQPDPEHCKFKFDISPEAAEHNLGIIRGHQYDLDAALKAAGGTALRYGSEFKPPSILGLLLEKYPLWDSISSSLSNGIKYPLEQITCHARR